MGDFDIKFDLSPYYPDIFLKDKIYQSMDKVDYTTYISVNSTIFIFNINCSETELPYYNDPGYLLFGIKKQDSGSDYNYKVPSTYFFNYIQTSSSSLTYTPYKIINSLFKPNSQILNLLTSIGYNVNLINTGETSTGLEKFTYYELEINDVITSKKRIVYYLFFTVNELTSINYNYYNSTTYYSEIYNNVFIYPYINIPIDKILGLNKNLNVIYNPDNYISSSTEFIDRIDFDDKEITKYYEKIDYKYMERQDYYNNQNNKLELLKYLSKNYINFEDFFLKSTEQSIVIQTNEISKTYFSNMDYEDKNLNSLTLTKLNNNHINKNTSLSGKDKKYSFSLDNKLSFVKKYIDFNNFRYCPYNYSILNTPSIYQLTKNYYVNGYVNILKPIVNYEIMYVINSYLYKTLVLINPQIINLLNLISSNINLSIYNIFSTNNNLYFGNGADKINLHILGTLKYTDTFYIDKYKIVFSVDTGDGKILEYIIILGICYYNSDNINILETNLTRYTDDLGYILYTNLECSVSLTPQIYNKNSLIKIYENKQALSLFDIKNIMMFINNNTNINNINNENKDILFSNYYTFIPYFKPTLKHFSKGIEIPPAKLLNININKINNFIKNLINLSTNILELITNKLLLNFFNNFVYDINLENTGSTYNYIENFSYFPIIELNSKLPNTIDKYRLYTEIPNIEFGLEPLPAGYYKVVKYINFFPKNNFDTVSIQNDKIVLTINEASKFIENNFCLLIKLPNDTFVDDDFTVKILDESKSYYMDSSNYSFNIGSSNTEMFLVVANDKNEIYINTENIVYGYKLFNKFNSNSGLNELGNKYLIKFKLYISSYLNFYQMILYSNIFVEYNENKNSIIDIDKSYLELHNKLLLKDIVYYDFLRFNYNTDLNSIILQYKTYNIQITNLLYDSKYYTNLIKVNINRLVYISNTNKIVVYSNKIYNYLKLIRDYIILGDDSYEFLLDLINYDANLCLNLTNVNYDIGTTYSINNYFIQGVFTFLIKINKEISLESISELINSVDYLIKYFTNKINLTVKQVLNDNNDVEKSINSPPTVKYIFSLIEEFIFKYELNQILLLEIQKQISNLESTEVFVIIKRTYPLLEDNKVWTFIDLIICLLNIYNLNTKKIDELINLVRLMVLNDDIVEIFLTLNNKVVKNFSLYNTTYYTNNLTINNFNIEKFFTDYKICIEYFSNPTYSSPTTYLYYVKSIDEGIIIFINNTINYFQLIYKQLIGIYKFIYNINIGIIPKIDIYQPVNISNLYYLLTEFEKNYNLVQSIANTNVINIFVELNQVIDFFNSYVSSIKEFLFYIQIKIYFQNLSIYNVLIFQDILKILDIEELYTEIKNIIDLINKLNDGDQLLINEFMQTVYEETKLKTITIKSPQKELDELKTILKDFKFGQVDLFQILKTYILKSIIIVKKIDNLDNQIKSFDFQGEEIVVYQDLNLLYGDFYFNSFNFKDTLVNILKESNDYKLSILDYYYQTPNIEFYKELINYNFLNNKFIINSLNGFDSQNIFK
jgi:hypothetical protein